MNYLNFPDDEEDRVDSDTSDVIVNKLFNKITGLGTRERERDLTNVKYIYIYETYSNCCIYDNCYYSNRKLL